METGIPVGDGQKDDAGLRSAALFSTSRYVLGLGHTIATRTRRQYYNEVRPHLSLGKDAPIPREAKRAGRVLALTILGGLHHRYVRV
jgi:transposase InsO family protein